MLSKGWGMGETRVAGGLRIVGRRLDTHMPCPSLDGLGCPRTSGDRLRWMVAHTGAWRPPRLLGPDPRPSQLLSFVGLPLTVRVVLASGTRYRTEVVLAGSAESFLKGWAAGSWLAGLKTEGGVL